MPESDLFELSRYRWLGTAGFELRLGASTVLVDPFLSRSAGATPRLHVRLEELAADAILVTHGHFDHAADVPAIARHTLAPVYASAAVCATLHDSGVPARQLHPLAGGRTIHVGAIQVRAIPSRHVRFDLPLVWRTVRRAGRRGIALLREMSAYPQGEVLGYQFTVDGRDVVHLGSAGWYREELEQLHPEVGFIPLQGHSHIQRIALQMVRLLRPRRVVPHHHDNFYPPISQEVALGPFLELLRAEMPGVELVQPRVGEWMPLFGTDPG